MDAHTKLHPLISSEAGVPSLQYTLDLKPRLWGELRRERFDVTDKGRSWFELDHEILSFRPAVESKQNAQFEDIVIDTRLKKRDPELIRRVETIRRLSEISHGIRPAEHVPHERAVQQLFDLTLP